MNLGLIGRSVSHSFSKTYFEEKFLKDGLTGCSYQNFDLDSLRDLHAIINSNRLTGLNVTKPYKQEVLAFLNELDDTARTIGAVNCIKVTWENGVPFLRGYNTDHYGFSQSIKPFLEPAHRRALIVGTGGASQAVYYALKTIGVDAYFVTSSSKKGDNYFFYEELNEHVFHAFKLIVNCTPLGLFPETDQCPAIPYEFITGGHLLYDLIYNPAQTLFLEKGKAQGATVINGLNMLKLQAEKGWEIWTAK